jgi:hypothetical protein
LEKLRIKHLNFFIFNKISFQNFREILSLAKLKLLFNFVPKITYITKKNLKMNFKTTLSTIGFCLLFTTKIFSGIGIEDLSCISSNPTTVVTYTNCMAMPVAVTAQKEYVCNWNQSGSCNNGVFVYKVSLIPNQKFLLPYNFTVRQGGWITPIAGSSMVLDSTNDQATIDNYFVVKFTSTGFKINFSSSANSSKYSVNVTRCCKIITNIPPPPPMNKVSNYPNPTNGTVNIKYDIAQKTNTSILVFDKYNRLVKQVIKNEKQEVGEQNIQFDTYDLNDGIYYIRIQTGKEIVIKTMVVSKDLNY